VHILRHLALVRLTMLATIDLPGFAANELSILIFWSLEIQINIGIFVVTNDIFANDALQCHGTGNMSGDAISLAAHLGALIEPGLKFGYNAMPA